MSKRPHHCLITGGSGYLGSELANYLRKKGWYVTTASRQPKTETDTAKFTLGEDIPPGLLDGIDVLIHAAYDFAPRSWEEINQTNVIGSKKLLQAAKAAGVASIITISSISAFPACKSFYGKAKLLMEEATLAVGGTPLRPGLIYGGSNSGIYGRLKKQAGKKIVPLLSGSSCTLHMTHVDDLARVIMNCADGYSSKQNGPWIVAHPEPWPLKKLLQAMVAARGKKLIFIPVPWQLVLAGLKFFEAIGLPRDFKSDNLISIVNQDPHLDFRAVQACGVEMRPFQPDF
jgi:nucleoside-diphosphate-sugar epimerase